MSANPNDTPRTLFDMTEFERPEAKGKDDAEVKRITVHVKKTEYERRVPTRKKKSAAPRKGKPKQTIAERFAVYHEANPHVYKMLVALARRDLNGGMRHGGMQMYIEQVRFKMRRRTETTEPFKISNDFAAHYARLIMAQESDLVGFFEVRDLKSK